MPKKTKQSAPQVPLTGKHKSYLRSLAHKLKPVVQIGHQGSTEGVLSALAVALERHELIKVKVSAEAESDADELAPQIAKATKSQVAQIIGHTIVLYRRRDEDPKIVLPRVKPAKPATSKQVLAVEPEEDDDGDDDEDFEDEEDDEDDEDEDLE